MSAAGSLTLEQVQEHIDKEVTVVLTDGDRGTKEVVGTIVKATIAGIPFKPKGKAGIDLLTLDEIYDITAAPVKAVTIKQKKIKPITDGQVRQHLADRHGTSLKWCKEATEADAKSYHDELDHADCGHVHITDEPKADERAEAIADA